MATANVTPTRRSWTDWLKARWPTAVALALTALILSESTTADDLTGLSGAVLVMALEYLVIAKLRRRAWSWPVVVALAIPVVILGEQDVVDPAVFLSALALVVLVWGAADGQLRRPDPFRVQALGTIGFGALALAGLVLLGLDPDLGRYLVAAGWFLHGIWDFVHLRLDRVVARSYAEACGVSDVLVAAGLVFMS